MISWILASLVTGCGEKTTDTSTPIDTAVNTVDCGEWGDCYGECMSPYESNPTWTVPQDTFLTYLDSAGQLSDAQCEQICRDFNESENSWEVIYQILSCADQGVDANGDELIACEMLMEPFCEGRRHAFVDLVHRSKGSVQAFLQQAAQAEMASIQAFLHLRKELTEHQAPQYLLDRCLQAAREEVHHARLLGQVCHRMGWEVQSPTSKCTAQRSLVELARENMVEGCINEAYSALQAHIQSQKVSDPTLKTIFAIIAKDESQHAELAKEIHQWMLGQLSQEELQSVEEAKAIALQQLIAFHQQSKAPSKVKIATLGLPTQQEAMALSLKLREYWLQDCA